MSRVNMSINNIARQLDRISGLDGIVADMVAQKEKEITEMVEDILVNHPNANLFDYEGKPE